MKTEKEVNGILINTMVGIQKNANECTWYITCFFFGHDFTNSNKKQQKSYRPMKNTKHINTRINNENILRTHKSTDWRTFVFRN